jgi:hypothetical protein
VNLQRSDFGISSAVINYMFGLLKNISWNLFLGNRNWDFKCCDILSMFFYISPKGPQLEVYSRPEKVYTRLLD